MPTWDRWSIELITSMPPDGPILERIAANDLVVPDLIQRGPAYRTVLVAE